MLRWKHRHRYAATLALLVATSGCGTAVCRDAWFGPDKTAHFAAGFAGAAAASTLAGHQGWSTGSSAGVGIGLAAAGGAVKETIDLSGSRACWSWKEFTWVLLGGALGASLGTAASH